MTTLTIFDSAAYVSAETMTPLIQISLSPFWTPALSADPSFTGLRR